MKGETKNKIYRHFEETGKCTFEIECKFYGKCTFEIECKFYNHDEFEIRKMPRLSHWDHRKISKKHLLMSHTCSQSEKEITSGNNK